MFKARHSIVLIVLVLVALVGCQQQPAATPEEPMEEEPTEGEAVEQEVVELTYWHGWSVEHEREAMEAAVELFNESHPNIQVEPISGKTNDQVLTAISGGNPPDTYALWSTQTLAQWAAQGLITNLDDLVNETGLDEETLYPAARDIAQYKGEWYGLPIEIDAMAVYYNKGLFEEAGLDPGKTPATLEEMFQIAEELTVVDDAGNVEQLGFTGWPLPEHIVYMFEGAWWNSDTGAPTANDPNNIAAWTLMKDWYDTFGAERVATFEGQEADNPLGSLFLAGKVGMALDGDWTSNFMGRYAPDMEWGVFPLPPAEGHEDAAMSTPVDGSIYVVPSGTEHPEEAWEFVRWMGTSKEASCLLQKAWANGSPVLAVAQDEACLPNPQYEIFLELMGAGKMQLWPPIAVSAFYNDQMWTASDAVIYGDKTPEQALKDMQQKVVEELDKASD